MRRTARLLLMAAFALPMMQLPFQVVSAEPGATFAGLHASYDVEVWSHANGRWEAPPADAGVPEHWEWWTTPAVAVDVTGQEIPTTAFHQATWLPEANWTDVTVTHVNQHGEIMRQDSRWFGQPPFYSDVGFNFGANNFQLTAAGPTEKSQTVEEIRFGSAALPCGYMIASLGAELVVSGSCGTAWPSGVPTQQRLMFRGDSELDGRDATMYGNDDAQVWMVDGIAVPVRIQSTGLRLDLVGFRAGESRPDVQAPSVGRAPPAAMPWTMAAMQPWGLDEEGAEHANPFPASEAYQAALQSAIKAPLALFLVQHPEARTYAVQASSWKAGERAAHRWDFLIADEEAVWNGSVVREIEGPLVTTTSYGVSHTVQEFERPLPRLGQLPATLPTLESVLARWSGWTGEGPEAANAWGYEFSCADTDCSAVDASVTAGRAMWEFPTQRLEQSLLTPSRMQGTSSVAAFALDGSPRSITASDWRTERIDNVGFRASEQSLGAPRPQPRLWGIEQSDAKAIAGLALTGALAAIAYRFFPLAIGLYARIRTDNLPEHPTRAAILDLVTASPGIRYTDLLRIMGGGKGALEYHLRLLENGGHVVLVKRNGLATYFRTRQAAEGHAGPWLRSTTARRILGLLAEQPLPTAALHALAGCSRSTAHSHLVRIEAAGLVERAGTQARITEAGIKAWHSVRQDQRPVA